VPCFTRRASAHSESARMSGVELTGVKPMRKHTVRAITSLLSAVGVLLFVVCSSAAVADARVSVGGRSSVSSGRHAGQSAGRMGRAVRAAPARGGRYTVGQNRGGRWRGWFNRGRRYDERAFISVGGGSLRGRYRSSGAFFFGYSFSASEYRRGSGPRYRRDLRREYRRDADDDVPVPRATLYVPLVASPAPEVLPRED
jgi:hypothetical protein